MAAQNEGRWIYSRHSKRDLAERMLEHFFAIGEISEGERPCVEKRGHWWCVTLPVETA